MWRKSRRTTSASRRSSRKSQKSKISFLSWICSGWMSSGASLNSWKKRSLHSIRKKMRKMCKKGSWKAASISWNMRSCRKNTNGMRPSKMFWTRSSRRNTEKPSAFPAIGRSLSAWKRQMSSARTLATVWRRAQRRWTGLRRNCLQHAENMQNGSNPVHSRSRWWITPNTRKNGVLCRKASCPDTKKKFGRHGKAQWSNSRTISLPNWNPASTRCKTRCTIWTRPYVRHNLAQTSTNSV